jgi:flagellar FliL protein
MAEQEVQLAPSGGGGKGRLRIFIIAGAALLLVAGGAVAYLTGAIPGKGGQAEGAEGHAPEPRAEPLYIPIEPAFTVNLRGEAGANRYLQTTVELLTRDPATDAAVKRHLPVIRDQLVMLFSSQDLQGITSQEGKERLRAEALASVRKLLEAETGRAGVEQVLFTSFVMQ